MKYAACCLLGSAVLLWGVAGCSDRASSPSPKPESAPTPKLDPSPTPQQGALIASVIQHCVIPIHSASNHGTIFFPTSEWGLTAAHAVDFITEEQEFAISTDGSDTGLRLRMAAPEGALEEGRSAELDWAVLRTQGDAGPLGGCDLTLAPDYELKQDEVVFPVGLLGVDFAAYAGAGELRMYRLQITDPMPGVTADDDLIWMRWPFQTAPKGFSGGPVFAMVDDAPAIVGITVQAVFQGEYAWLVARRINSEVIDFAQEE